MWKFSCIGHRMITTTQMQSPSLITLFAYILCVMCAMDEITKHSLYAMPKFTQPDSTHGLTRTISISGGTLVFKVCMYMTQAYCV